MALDTRILALALALFPGAPAVAQSLYVDFGASGSPGDAPSSSYGVLAPPGVWNAVSTSPAAGLVDTSGAPLAVTITTSGAPMIDTCGHAGTSGDDAALYDDRWYFDPVTLLVTVAGLPAGTYRVHAHLLIGPCIAMFSPLSVTIVGATPGVAAIGGVGWTGAPTAGVHVTTQYASLAPGQALELQLSSPAGFVSYTQICGLQVVRVEAPLPFCFGDGSGTTCPCANAGAPGRGCENSLGTGGALLRATFGGLPSVTHDSMELNASGMPPSASALFFQGTTQAAGGAGTTFGDGLRCAGGSIVRIATRVASAGAASYPGPGDASISTRGGVPAGGGTRTYQTWYRNSAAFCQPETFNLSNGLQLVWGP